MKAYRVTIALDLQRLKLKVLITTTSQNEFIQMLKSNAYIYVHKEHVQASGVTFTNIARASKPDISEIYEGVWQCKDANKSHDEGLFPFFLNNPLYYKDAMTTQTPTGRTKVQKHLESIEGKQYFCDHQTYENVEDVWTKRLSIAIKFHYTNCNVMYTAKARVRESNSVVLQSLSKHHLIFCFMDTRI